MKSKSTIKIVETPIIDGYDFHENNGVINPAFLDVQTTAEEDNRSANSGQPLVSDSDYRGNYFKTQSPQPQNPSGGHSLERTGNGQHQSLAVASSWVYNNGSSSSSQMDSPVTATNTNTLSDIYRAPFGIRYNEHLSYEMDLSRDHRKSRGSGACWPSLVKLFVWSVIIVSLLGIICSIGFIIYIEKFAVHTCCEGQDKLNITSSRRNGSAIIPVQKLNNSEDIPLSTPQSYTKLTTYVTTTASPVDTSRPSPTTSPPTTVSPITSSEVTPVGLSETLPVSTSTASKALATTTTTTTSTTAAPETEPELGTALPEEPSSDVLMSTVISRKGLNSNPESTTERMTATEPTVRSMVNSSETTTVETPLEPRLLTQLANSSTASVSPTDRILDNNSSVTPTPITGHNSQTIITTDSSLVSPNVINKTALYEEAVITGANRQIETSSPSSQTVRTGTEGQPIGHKGGQDLTTAATPTTTGEFEYYYEDTTTTAPIGTESAVDESYIKSIFG